MQPVIARTARPQSARRAFTLIEALMATGILLAIVVSVISAITAGQQNAYEAHERSAGAPAAEELMGRLVTESYSKLAKWNGFRESVGQLTDVKGQSMPDSFDMVGREVTVTSGLQVINDLSVKVQGRSITVRSFNAYDRTLAQINRFFPEPQS